MKERTVIEIPKDMCDNCNGCDKPTSALVECYLDEPRQAYETVKVPETFEELKELCKDLKGLYKNYNIEVFDDAIFVLDSKVVLLKIYDDGEIKDSGSEVIAKNRTPAQMWQIIKSLIGEE